MGTEPLRHQDQLHKGQGPLQGKSQGRNTYVENSGSTTAGRNKYDSINNMAKIGDKFKDYIAKIASASITNNNTVANMREANKSKDAKLTAMASQFKQLTPPLLSS
jgi:hypothetical protein